MKPLTQRQTEILKLIQSFVENTGFPPTRSDIARALNFKSANAAEDHLKAIEKKDTSNSHVEHQEAYSFSRIPDYLLSVE